MYSVPDTTILTVEWYIADIRNGLRWCTLPDKGIIPITEEKHKYGAMINPLNEEYRTHILNVLKEVVTKYPDLDGLMLDRVRYDGITADFFFIVT